MIRVYEPGDLSSGFVGIRVAVSVNAKVKQKYWSRNDICTEHAMEYAVAYEQKLLKQQLQHFRNRVFSRSNNTGISGLHISVEVCKKKYGAYLYNRLSYQYRKGDKFVSKSFYIKDYNISDDQWFDICYFIKNSRTCNQSMFDKMLTKKPTEQQIRKVLEPIRKAWNEKT